MSGPALCGQLGATDPGARQDNESQSRDRAQSGRSHGFRQEPALLLFIGKLELDLSRANGSDLDRDREFPTFEKRAETPWSDS